MKHDSVAGVSVGRPKNTVILISENGEHREMVIKGRQLYVKKCLRSEQIGGIILCDASRGDTVYALILGISDDCGKYHKLTEEQRRAGQMPSVNMSGVEPNMKCVTPDNHPWGILRSPYGTDEFLIREDIIKWVE